MSIETYIAHFYLLEARVKVKWDEDIMVAMYMRGLHLHIAAGLCSVRFPTLDYVVHIAY